jgi:hypothetical protein
MWIAVAGVLVNKILRRWRQKKIIYGEYILYYFYYFTILLFYYFYFFFIIISSWRSS